MREVGVPKGLINSLRFNRNAFDNNVTKDNQEMFWRLHFATVVHESVHQFTRKVRKFSLTFKGFANARVCLNYMH